jgi:hypothetical protein
MAVVPVMEQVGGVKMVVVAEVVAVQPTELVTVTVQVPAVLTEMVRVVAPVDHR